MTVLHKRPPRTAYRKDVTSDSAKACAAAEAPCPRKVASLAAPEAEDSPKAEGRSKTFDQWCAAVPPPPLHVLHCGDAAEFRGGCSDKVGLCTV